MALSRVHKLFGVPLLNMITGWKWGAQQDKQRKQMLPRDILKPHSAGSPSHFQCRPNTQLPHKSSRKQLYISFQWGSVWCTTIPGKGNCYPQPLPQKPPQPILFCVSYTHTHTHPSFASENENNWFMAVQMLLLNLIKKKKKAVKV
jgi:hypothetical protein